MNYFSNYIITSEIPFYIPRTIQYNNNNGVISNIKSLTFNGVPAIIYQTFESKKITDNIKKIIEDNLKTNSEFDYYFYDDNDCLQFITDNFDDDVVNAYNSLIPGAYKADLWRYCILYKNGGIYMDIKFKIQTPLIKYLQTHPIAFVKDLEDNYIYNAILIAPPGLDIFKNAIEQIVLNCKIDYYGNNNLDPTGPGLLGKIIYNTEYEKYISLYLDKDIYNQLTIKDKETDEVIFESYNRIIYKTEQYFMSKKYHYSVYWNNKNIYIK
jgi:mannosyltransferase OCH1-like enzyme